jgi:hypothetical protein
MTMMLRKENKKLRTELNLIRHKVNDGSNINETIDRNSFSLARSVDLVGEEATDEMEAYKRLLKQVDKAKGVNKIMKKQIMDQQDTIYGTCRVSLAVPEVIGHSVASYPRDHQR